MDLLPRTIRAGCTRTVSRRHVLQVGGLGLMGLTLPRLLAAQQSDPLRLTPKADACIVLFLNGGPSHLDMWDMKPDAPDGIRGEFKPIATKLPGLQVSEHLPRLAGHMHRATLVRSVHHGVNGSHALAVYTSMTGHDRGDATNNVGAGPTDYPTLGSVFSKFRPPAPGVVPHVCLPYITKEGAGGPPQPGYFAGFLGRAYDPLFVLKDPNSADFAVPELTLLADVSVERLEARQALFRQLDQFCQPSTEKANYGEMDSFRQRALGVLTSESTQHALRIGDEAPPKRDRYGRNIYGQSVLLARRLVEAGTRLVTVSWAPDANATWDTHGSNFDSLRTRLLPEFDAACSSLIEDLEERGMLDRTLIAVLGDFGRTPKINSNKGGRDHWNYCYSLMFVGGGFKPGYVYGASDKIGAFPARDAVTAGDITATIYRALGISQETLLHDQLGRPHRLVERGTPILDLLS